MTGIALALGGGGSKGYAHLGVIRALEDMGFDIQAISGTSAGAMAGIVYAAGFSPDQILDRVSQVNQEDLFGFGRGPGLLSNSGVQKVLEEFVRDKEFADLGIPCSVTAVDLREKSEVILQTGKVIDSLMAAIAIPGIFPPQEVEDYLLVDGMVLNPVPVSAARKLAPELPVVAVSLTPEPEQWKASSPWDRQPANPLLRPIARLRIAKAFEIYSRSMDITLHMLGEIRLQLDEPEILIRPAVSHVGSLDRVDVYKIADLGEKATLEVEKDLKKLKRKARKRKRRRG